MTLLHVLAFLGACSSPTETNYPTSTGAMGVGSGPSDEGGTEDDDASNDTGTGGESDTGSEDTGPV